MVFANQFPGLSVLDLGAWTWITPDKMYGAILCVFGGFFELFFQHLFFSCLEEFSQAVCCDASEMFCGLQRLT